MLEADIFCLKTPGDNANTLNFRPLALLNTDYKVFTRVLATRVRMTLPETIHLNQTGFVQGRTIHDTIDLFEVAQVVAALDCDEATAIAYY